MLNGRKREILIIQSTGNDMKKARYVNWGHYERIEQQLKYIKLLLQMYEGSTSVGKDATQAQHRLINEKHVRELRDMIDVDHVFFRKHPFWDGE